MREIDLKKDCLELIGLHVSHFYQLFTKDYNLTLRLGVGAYCFNSTHPYFGLSYLPN